MQQYSRDIVEDYGPSTVELAQMDIDDSNIGYLQVDGKDMLFPVLDLKKFDSNCNYYLLIERLKKYPITMIDILYTYGEISFEDDNFRKKFLEQYDRKHINFLTMKNLGIMVRPENRRDLNSFAKAIKLSIEDSIGDKICLTSINQNNKFKVEEKQETERKDSILLDTAKILYRCLGGVVKKESPIVKEVEYSLIKGAFFLKNGEILINGVETSRYLTMFKTQSRLNENQLTLKNNELSDIRSVYITGVRDYSLMSNPDYYKKFGKIVLLSNILEALYAVNINGIPNFAYVGELDMKDERIKVNLNIEKYFNEMNELLFPSRNGDGR